MTLLNTRLTLALNLRHPIVSAPMAFAAGGRLAAAVSQAGGLGLIGGGYGDAQWLEEQFRLAAGTPVGVGFITWSLRQTPSLLSEVLKHRPRAVMLSFGDPRPFVDEIRAAGALLICQCQNLEHVRDAVAVGADLVVAQGAEAGGHGATRGTLSLVPEVADHLNAIARAFEKYLDISDLKIVDLTISGSNAAYTYTAHSDVDLHLVVDVPVGRQEFMRKYFDAKKNLFNEQHDITVNDQPVELYVQFSDQPHVSAGIYSVMRGRWIEKPRPVRADINHTEVQNKLMQYIKLIKSAIDGGTSADLEQVSAKIRDLRKSGLAATGEWGTDNLVFKILRNQGILDQLSTLKTRWQDQELSLEEEQL